MRLIKILLAFFFFPACLFAQQEEHLTITTYYPSPYGSYNELRTNQMVIGGSSDPTGTPAPGFEGGLTFKSISSPAVGPAGTMYYDSTNVFKYSDGTNWQDFGGGGAPSGAVMFFNLATCPSGWTAMAAAQGRYLVGLPSGGTLAGTQGTELSNLENRATGKHNHSITIWGSSGGGNVLMATAGVQGFGTWDTQDAGSVAGTNAPYIQLLVCQKD